MEYLSKNMERNIRVERYKLEFPSLLEFESDIEPEEMDYQGKLHMHEHTTC